MHALLAAVSIGWLPLEVADRVTDDPALVWVKLACGHNLSGAEPTTLSLALATSGWPKEVSELAPAGNADRPTVERFFKEHGEACDRLVLEQLDPAATNGDLLTICVACRLVRVADEVGARDKTTGGWIKEMRNGLEMLTHVFFSVYVR